MAEASLEHLLELDHVLVQPNTWGSSLTWELPGVFVMLVLEPLGIWCLLTPGWWLLAGQGSDLHSKVVREGTFGMA